MLDRVANSLSKVVSPISRVLSDISIVVMSLVVLLVVVDVSLRRLFNSPLTGSVDAITLAFTIIVFLPLAWHAFNDGHIEIDFLVQKFPKAAQRILEVIMMFITIVILGMMGWRLLVHGTALQAAKAESICLGIPLYPFVYLTALGSIMVALAFLIRFLHSLSIVIKER